MKTARMAALDLAKGLKMTTVDMMRPKGSNKTISQTSKFMMMKHSIDVFGSPDSGSKRRRTLLRPKTSISVSRETARDCWDEQAIKKELQFSVELN